MTERSAESGRLLSLDQFRGFTVAAMVLVNFLGDFRQVPALFRHHNTWCSYADVIMPQFFLAAGWALRLVWLREAERTTQGAARGRAMRRALALLLFGVVFYGLQGGFRSWAELQAAGWSGFFRTAFWRDPLQALTHIALTTLWVLPVIGATGRTRLLRAAGSGLLHLALSSWFWYDLLQEKRVIDGGLLGFLTWTIPFLAGSWLCDAVRQDGWQTAARRTAGWSAGLMVTGYAISCLNAGGGWNAPPFFPPQAPVDLWTMSQRAGSLSYLTFAAGWSLATAAVFLLLGEGCRFQSGLFDALGRNALAAYILHFMLMSPLQKFTPSDAPLWWVLSMSGLCLFLTWVMTRWMNARGLYLRL